VHYQGARLVDQAAAQAGDAVLQVAVLAEGDAEALVKAADGLQGAATVEGVAGQELALLQPLTLR
jgi:hypothetical protein